MARPASKAFLAALAKQRGLNIGRPRTQKPKRKSSETPLVTATVEMLNLKGYWAWRANSGALRTEYKGKESLTLLSPAGTPDILVVIKRDIVLVQRDGIMGEHTLGVLGGLEAKSEAGKQRASQKRWEKQADANGVRYAIFRSIGEALAIVERWKAGES